MILKIIILKFPDWKNVQIQKLYGFENVQIQKLFWLKKCSNSKAVKIWKCSAGNFHRKWRAEVPLMSPVLPVHRYFRCYFRSKFRKAPKHPVLKKIGGSETGTGHPYFILLKLSEKFYRDSRLRFLRLIAKLICKKRKREEVGRRFRENRKREEKVGGGKGKSQGEPGKP